MPTMTAHASSIQVRPQPPAKRKRSRKRARSGDSADSMLRRYLDAMGRYETFTPEEEQAAAERIAQGRIERWAALLSYSPLYESIRARIEDELEVDEELQARLDKLAETADLYRRRRTLTNERAYFADIIDVAELLPPLDKDSELAEALIADVERLARNEREGLSIEVARMPGNSRPFHNWHARCRRAETALRRSVEAFAHANLRLVISLARRLGHGQLPLPDLIQEGNLGLLKAVERFDPSRGFRFSTYAGWWIRHAISRAIYNKSREVRLPVHVHDVQQKLRKGRRLFEGKHGREPTLAELAEEVGLPLAKVEKIDKVDNGPIASLSQTVSPNDDRTALELLEDDAPPPGTELESMELSEGLEAAIDELRPMEADILRRRFGLDGCEPETLREIGERYALSRERIRQLQARAVNKLRGEFRQMDLM